MCSQKRGEIEVAKAELSAAGITCEIRNNPTAEALGVTGIELWVKDESDFARAANLCAEIRARSRGCLSSTPANPAAGTNQHPVPPAAPQVEMVNGDPPAVDETSSTRPGEALLDKLSKDCSFVEKQIEEILEFQREVASQCACAHAKVIELRQALVRAQAALTFENEELAAARAHDAEELARLQKALERQRLDREQIELQLEYERVNCQRTKERLTCETRQWQQQSESQANSLSQAQETVGVQAKLLQTHAAAVLKLRREIEALEAQTEQDRKSISKMREDMALERKARIAAEDRVQNAAAPAAALRLPSLFRGFSRKKGSEDSASP